MVMVSKSGQMVPNTKVTGRMIKQMAMVNSFMLMEIFMRVNGRMIKHMVMEIIHMLTEQLIAVNGKMTSNMERELKPGLMVQNTRDNTSRAKSTTRAH